MKHIRCQGHATCGVPAVLVASWRSEPMRAPAFWYLCAEHADIAEGLPNLQVRKLADVLEALVPGITHAVNLALDTQQATHTL